MRLIARCLGGEGGGWGHVSAVADFDWEECVDGCDEGGLEVNMPVAGRDPFYPVGEGA